MQFNRKEKMKIGPRTYTQDESETILLFKKRIANLNGEINDLWEDLVGKLGVSGEIPNPEADYLWDFVFNDSEQ